MKKYCILLLIILLGTSTVPTFADSPDISAKAVFAVEVSTGKILYDKNAQEPLPIASLSKLLTTYLVYEEIAAGRLSMDTPVTLSDYAVNLMKNPAASNIPMAKREYSVKELLEASLITSANSASIALAEKIAGSETAFVDKMKAQLDHWGITDYHLVNATGLNSSAIPKEHLYPGAQATDENHLSAQAIGLVAYHLIQKYPQVLEITSQSRLTFDGNDYKASNLLLKGQPNERPEVDGLKTGTTELSGPSLATTSMENGMRILTIVLNAKTPDNSPNARYEVTQQLLDHIKTSYHLKTVWQKGQAKSNLTLSIKDGVKSDIPLVAAEDLTIITPIKPANPNQLKISTQSFKSAPIKQGETLGSATLLDNNLVGKGYLVDPPKKIPLIAGQSIDKEHIILIWWKRLISAFK